MIQEDLAGAGGGREACLLGANSIGEQFGDPVMLRNTVIQVIVAVLCVGILSGCSKKTEPAPTEPEQVKTASEYKAEADKEITEQNMGDELNRLEKEVGAEANAVDANQT